MILIVIIENGLDNQLKYDSNDRRIVSDEFCLVLSSSLKV